MPALAGCEINDDPLAPICQAGRALVAEQGDRAPIEWLPRERRYGEKLATPDITIADLIGEVDPIKVAEGRYLSDELTIHYGLLPRTHRGIFALNELPDLAERIQVGLLNIMEERDVQIRGYKVRLPLDLYVVACANPEDYTNRGRIITPLKDRFGSQIRTHYPRTLAHEIAIMEQERTRFAPDGYQVEAPEYMKQIVAELTHLARRSAEISQRSGVSVRVSICNYENLLSSALKRPSGSASSWPCPASATSAPSLASTAGKIELETVGDGDEDKVLERLMQKAVLNVFNRHFQAASSASVVEAFEGGLTCEVSDAMPSAEYVQQAGRSGRLRRPRCASSAPPAIRPRRRRHRVRAGGPAPQQEAQQGRAGRPATGTGAERAALPLLALGRHAEAPDLDADELLAAMADDLLADGDPWRALAAAHAAGGCRTREGRADARPAGPAGAAAPRSASSASTATTSAPVLEDIKKKLDDI